MTQRVLVVGSPAAGKSYFCREIEERLSLPLHHLDYYAWQDIWDEDAARRKKQWYAYVKNLSKKELWILDCNNMTALEAAVGRADTILFLDYSRFLRMFRVFKRYVKYRKKLRSDMPPGWQEKLEIQFIKQIWNFEKNDRLKIMSILNEESQKNIRVFKSPRESKKYLASL